MKNKILSLGILFLSLIDLTRGQGYDPYVNLLTLSPNSPYATNNLPFVSVNGTATFRVGAQAGAMFDDLEWGVNAGCTDAACKLYVTVIPTSGTTIITGIPSSGTFVSKFDWEILPDGSLRGTQKSDAPGLIESPNGGAGANPGTQGTNWGTVIVPIRHIAPSTISDPVGTTHPCNIPGNICSVGFTQGFNGVVVNVQPPTQPSNSNNLTSNDNIGAYVYARTKLPIQYIDFSLIDKQEEGIQILWKTINETNTKEFEVERKYPDSEKWEIVGKKPAAGNSRSELTYDLIDDKYSYKSKIYYRIKHIDLDGTFKYTSVKSINLSKVSNVNLSGFPNPTKDIYHLSFNSKTDAPIQIEVIDLLGRTAFKQKASAVKGYNQYDLEMKDVAAGTYFVKVSGKEIYQTLTVVKTE